MDQQTGTTASDIKSIDLKERTRAFALRALRVVEALPNTHVADVLGRQLARSATSVGANYRSACRGRSPAEFRSKLGIVEEEADESDFWLDMIASLEIIKPELLGPLRAEVNEIVAMVVASIRTSKRNEDGEA